MNELLNKLLESELLTAESKQEITDAFNAHIEKVVSEAKEQATADVTTKLHEQHLHEKDMLIEAIDRKVNDFLKKEFLTIKEDIKDFRSLESEYAIKLAKEKKQLGEQFKKELKTLKENVGNFLEVRLEKEFNSIKQDLYDAKKLEFGRKIFEAYSREFKNHFVDPDQTEAELLEAKTKLDKLNKKYKNIKKDNEALLHKVKVENACKSLTGSAKELMESILQSVPTDSVDKTYKLYINKVLKENSAPAKKSKTISESTSNNQYWDNAQIVTGDDFSLKSTVNESVEQPNNPLVNEFIRLAGIG